VNATFLGAATPTVELESAPVTSPRREGPGRNLIDLILEARTTTGEEADSFLDRFLAEPEPWQSLALWLTHTSRIPALTKQKIAQLLGRQMAQIDALLSEQVNAILHHPDFQKLEASWRGLRYLVEQAPEGENIKIRVLNISWKEVSKDFERALEFDQSRLFRKIYGEEFGTPGGEPFSVLLGDYQIRHRLSPDSPMDDVATLMGLSTVAAASFAPFIASAHPSMLDLASFADLERPLNLPRTFEQLEYLKWRAFRQTDDARFIGLALPRVLMRLPYKEGGRNHGFRFREEVEAPDRSQYLWGNATYAFGAVLIRAFAETSWPADIRGAQRGVLGGGLVAGLPAHSFGTDKEGVALKCLTDGVITDAQEKELAELGFIPLCQCQGSEFAAFYSNQSVQKPPTFDDMKATANARLSAMLQYMLCVARFAHYIKVICRDKVGSFIAPSDCEDYLRKWLSNYTNASDTAHPDLRAQYPLREAKVQVREQPGKPGSYLGVIHLRPHFQLDQMVTSVKLVTELSAVRS
jgi:type VI secretion system ImpC/EvpB family protein